MPRKMQNIKTDPEYMDNLNNPMTIDNTESVVYSILTKKTPSQYGFQGKVLEHLRKELIQSYAKVSREWKK